MYQQKQHGQVCSERRGGGGYTFVLLHFEYKKVIYIYMYVYIIILSSFFPLELIFTSHNEVTRSKLWIHTIHLLAEKAYREKETLDSLIIEPGAKNTLIVPTMVRHTVLLW